MALVSILYFPDYVETVYILNPRTREYIILPEAGGIREWPNDVMYTFGFDPVRFEYKVCYFTMLLHQMILSACKD
uniref:F-box associated beta-propeller type 3 domain-containing protein n=1 Tax=Solanum lycopersicum TaxID=4081 RepID=A0A3Q7ITU1_SOLLC